MERVVYNAPVKVDRNNAAEVQSELNSLIDGGARDIVFDMSDTTYMSSAGLRVLVATQKSLLKNGSFVVTNIPSAIREILEVTGLASVMNIE